MEHPEAQRTGRGARRPAASVRHARQDRAAWWGGLLASVLLHALAFILWTGEAPEAGDGAPGARPPTLVAGGGGIRSVSVSMPDRLEIPPPPEPVPAIDVPELEVREVEVSLGGAAALPVAAPAPLPGVGRGPGRGDGGAAGAGDGYSSPVPRSVVPQWNPPGSVRGMEVKVRVFVDAQGRPSLVELDPPTPDDGFNREIIRQVRGWEYRPATRHGAAVEGWAEIVFIF